jgi:hypothetical protein
MSANEQPENESEIGRMEDETPQHVGEATGGVEDVPLFLRDRTDGQKGNAQDEKDETEE